MPRVQDPYRYSYSITLPMLLILGPCVLCLGGIFLTFGLGVFFYDQKSSVPIPAAVIAIAVGALAIVAFCSLGWSWLRGWSYGHVLTDKTFSWWEPGKNVEIPCSQIVSIEIWYSEYSEVHVHGANGLIGKVPSMCCGRLN